MEDPLIEQVVGHDDDELELNAEAHLASFVRRFGKAYHDDDEHAHWMSVFKANLRRTRRHQLLDPTAFKSRVVELQDLVLARSMFSVTALPDLASVDASVTTMESQVQAIRRRLQEELDAIPKAKKLINRSLKQQEKLQHMLANLPSGLHEDVFATHFSPVPFRTEGHKVHMISTQISVSTVTNS